MIAELAWTLALFPVTLYALAVITAGCLALRPARWEYCFQWLGVYELQRRNLGAMQKSARNVAIRTSIVGIEDIQEAWDRPDDPIFDLLSSLTGNSNTDRPLGTELCRLRRVLLYRSLLRQQRAAVRVKQLRYLPLVWGTVRTASACEVAARGIIKIIPSATQHIGKRLSIPFVLSQVAAVLLGCAYWTLGSPDEIDPPTTVSYFTTVGAIAATWIVIVKLFVELATQRWGHPRMWSRKAIALVTTILLVEYTLFVAVRMNAHSKIADLGGSISEMLDNRVVRQLENEPTLGAVVGGILMLVFIGWMVRNLTQKARSRDYAPSERVECLSLAVLLLLVGAFFIQLVTVGNSHATTTYFFTPGLGLIGVLLTISRIMATAEWNKRRKILSVTNIEIPGQRKLKKIILFCASYVPFVLIVDLAVDKIQSPVSLGLSVTVAGTVALLNLLLVPILPAVIFTIWLYARRVDKNFEQYVATYVSGHRDTELACRP